MVDSTSHPINVQAPLDNQIDNNAGQTEVSNKNSGQMSGIGSHHGSISVSNNNGNSPSVNGSRNDAVKSMVDQIKNDEMPLSLKDQDVRKSDKDQGKGIWGSIQSYFDNPVAAMRRNPKAFFAVGFATLGAGFIFNGIAAGISCLVNNNATGSQARDEGDLYQEQQMWTRLCGKHAANAFFGGPETKSSEFAKAADELYDAGVRMKGFSQKESMFRGYQMATVQRVLGKHGAPTQAQELRMAKPNLLTGANQIPAGFEPKTQKTQDAVNLLRANDQHKLTVETYEAHQKVIDTRDESKDGKPLNTPERIKEAEDFFKNEQVKSDYSASKKFLADNEGKLTEARQTLAPLINEHRLDDIQKRLEEDGGDRLMFNLTYDGDGENAAGKVHWVTMKKDDDGDWRLIDSQKGTQPKIDPADFFKQELGKGLQNVTILTDFKPKPSETDDRVATMQGTIRDLTHQNVGAWAALEDSGNLIDKDGYYQKKEAKEAIDTIQNAITSGQKLDATEAQDLVDALWAFGETLNERDVPISQDRINMLATLAMDFAEWQGYPVADYANAKAEQGGFGQPQQEVGQSAGNNQPLDGNNQQQFVDMGGYNPDDMGSMIRREQGVGNFRLDTGSETRHPHWSNPVFFEKAAGYIQNAADSLGEYSDELNDKLSITAVQNVLGMAQNGQVREIYDDPAHIIENFNKMRTELLNNGLTEDHEWIEEIDNAIVGLKTFETPETKEQFELDAARHVNRLTDIWDNVGELTANDFDGADSRYDWAEAIVKETEALSKQQVMNIDMAMGQLEFLKDTAPWVTEDGTALIREKYLNDPGSIISKLEDVRARLLENGLSPDSLLVKEFDKSIAALNPMAAEPAPQSNAGQEFSDMALKHVKIADKAIDKYYYDLEIDENVDIDDEVEDFVYQAAQKVQKIIEGTDGDSIAAHYATEPDAVIARFQELKDALGDAGIRKHPWVDEIDTAIKELERAKESLQSI